MSISALMMSLVVLALAQVADNAPANFTVRAKAIIQLSPTAQPKPVQLAIQDAKQLAELLGAESEAAAIAQAMKFLKVESLDFEMQTLLVVSVGPVHSGVVNIDIQELTQAKGGELNIAWYVTHLLGITDDPLFHYARLALIDKFTDKVHFETPEQQVR